MIREYINHLTIRDWMAIVAVVGLASSFLTVLIHYLFCTKRVPRQILVWRSLSLGAFFSSLFSRGLSDEPIPLDWNTIFIYANLALAQFFVMIFTYRRIIHSSDGGRGDRCPSLMEAE